MSISEITDVMQYGLITAIKVVGPILIISILIGFVIALFQAATQIHEQTLTFVPKLLAIAFVLVILGPWMASTMQDFVLYIFSMIEKLN
ncbi:MAG: flagellar biosynthesis protein FliQ [Clostridia bacterium]|nr:flagellar biosynthesis protein FliQ [Clostridia bacterium]